MVYDWKVEGDNDREPSMPGDRNSLSKHNVASIDTGWLSQLDVAVVVAHFSKLIGVISKTSYVGTNNKGKGLSKIAFGGIG